MDEFEDFVWALDIYDAMLLEDAMLILEMYEAAQVYRNRIESSADELLSQFGIE